MNRELKDSARFLFLELLDPEINVLLAGLRKVFGNGNASSHVHVTIRGPYSGEIPKGTIEKYEIIVRHHPIVIHGIDTFRNEGENVVFIRVHHESLRKVWWKRDFPIRDFGYNPHISLHKTPDPEFAKTIKDFLEGENINLSCNDFRLAPCSKQGVFPFLSIPRAGDFPTLSGHGLVRPDILQRAADVVAGYRKKHADGDIVHTG